MRLTIKYQGDLHTILMILNSHNNANSVVIKKNPILYKKLKIAG